MKGEKDIAEFFGMYSEKMIPEEKKLFMKTLKEKIDRLPVPSCFDAKEPELSREYARHMFDKMKREYRWHVIDTVISCVFAVAIIVFMLSLLYVSGIFSINTTVTLVAFAFVALTAVTFIFSMDPSSKSR